MKPLSHTLFITLFILLISPSGISQKPESKYTEYNYGEYLYYYKKWDSAFLMFNRYVNNPDDTLNKGKAYNYMAEMQWTIGDLYGAQQSLIGAISTLDSFNKSHRKEIGQSYNLLGNVSLDLKLYDEAIRDYDKAVNFFEGFDSIYEAINGKATALQKKGEYDQAIAIYDSILSIKKAETLLIARAIDNRARTKWLANPAYPALREFQTALKIRIDNQNSQGLNASYAHLSDYYAKVNSDSAIWYAQKMLQIAKLNRSPGDMLEAIDKLIRLNKTSSVKDIFYQQFKSLNDSLQFARDTIRNRFALIRYDFQKSKADNLALQQHITKQRLLMYGLAALAVVAIVALTIWYDKRRKRIKRESENAIRESRLKTSQKIHDVVANGLYGIMNELEHNKTIDQEPLITKIEQLYEKSRDISYENHSGSETTNYDRQIHKLLNSFSTESRKVVIVGNQPGFWNKISASQKKELELIINEIMINMKKHSDASNVVFVFKQENGKGHINYTDNGVGLPSPLEFGNGLKNTVSRIKAINGEIKFGKRQERGVSVELIFPLA